MGYFSNGTEGMQYTTKYCDRCIHGQDELKQCFIWALHQFWNYDDEEDRKLVLEGLIPRSEDGLSNEECVMFIAKEGE